jgi:hypothetical protein
MNFEELNSRGPKTPGSTMEELERQEKLDARIEEEAGKLKVNLDSLKKQIDEYGGLEKFKEEFEKNKAGDTIRKLQKDQTYEIKSRKSATRMAAILSAVMAVYLALLRGVAGPELQATMNEINQAYPIDDIHSNLVVTVLGLSTGFSIGSMIKEQTFGRIKQRRLKRQEKIEQLKFKMTGTEVK